MTFVPPRCPRTSCSQHHDPVGVFFWRHGSYQASCRDKPVPRFRCRHCRKGFSVQTFRHDYRDRRPECNELLFHLLASGVGLRQSARVLRMSPTAVQKKMCKTARTCRWLHRNLCPRLPPNKTYLLDEEETYESASIRAVTLPILIERESWFVVAATAGSIRRLAAAGTRRRRRQDREELAKGPRRDRSRTCVGIVLGRLAQKTANASLTLHSDEKASYRTVAKELFGNRVSHATTLSTRARTTANRLFAINTTIAMTRDNCGRLRRKTWLVSKKVQRLRLQMHIFMVYRNYVRKRFNRDADAKLSSATKLGVTPRAMTPAEVLRWRQDWKERSIHPLSFRGCKSIADPLQALA